ncbi:hypothetical protein LguiB_026968 [Lonicera macranthoides]
MMIFRYRLCNFIKEEVVRPHVKSSCHTYSTSSLSLRSTEAVEYDTQASHFQLVILEKLEHGGKLREILDDMLQMTPKAYTFNWSSLKDLTLVYCGRLTETLYDTLQELAAGHSRVGDGELAGEGELEDIGAHDHSIPLD